jgi:hypothetical protein
MMALGTPYPTLFLVALLKVDILWKLTGRSKANEWLPKRREPHTTTSPLLLCGGACYVLWSSSNRLTGLLPRGPVPLSASIRGDITRWLLKHVRR